MQAQEYQAAARSQPPRLLLRSRTEKQTKDATAVANAEGSRLLSSDNSRNELPATDADWDKPPKEIQLSAPSLRALRDQWCIQSGKAVAAPTLDSMDTKWHSEIEFDLLRYFNDRLDANKHLPYLELSKICSYIKNIVSVEIGKILFVLALY